MLPFVSWRRQRLLIPCVLWFAFSAVYVATSGSRILTPSENNHYVWLAHAWLEGRLDLGGDPPGTNDWACFDTETKGPCPASSGAFQGADKERYRWYVSFPPFPAAVIAPVVAIFGLATLDRLFWALLAGLAPAMLFVVLRWLRESGRSGRSRRDDYLLTALFGLGTVFYFVAVQGSVWFAAQVVATILLFAYIYFALDAQRPLLAGLMLGSAALCRPATALLGIFYVLEAVRVARRQPSTAADADANWVDVVREWLAPVQWREVLRRALPFTAVAIAVFSLGLWHNYARFGDLFEFGHRFLQIRWRSRIETWGLFGYHYFGRNLAIFVASLPWLLDNAPYLRISRHGLALWFTTPNLLWTLWPRRVGGTLVAAWLALLPVAVLTLLYQNSGWIQFGYRFSLDYMPLLFVILALSGRRFGTGFWACAILAIGINMFGAITFDRHGQFYDNDRTQKVIFQPD